MRYINLQLTYLLTVNTSKTGKRRVHNLFTSTNVIFHKNACKRLNYFSNVIASMISDIISHSHRMN